MRRIVVLSTGGTIAARVDRGSGHVVAAATGEELLKVLADHGHELPGDVEVVSEQFCNVGGFLFDLELSFQLARRAESLLANSETVGVVVTQGTDTMEESSFLADLLVGSDKPVVFTGAQRHADEPDSDGPRNLADAIRVAAAPDVRGCGALLVFDQAIHPARDVTKRHTARVGTFFSGEHGMVGEIDMNRVIIHRRPTLRGHFSVNRLQTAIDLIKLVMGSDGRLLRSARDSGAQGVVLEAFGRGNANLAVVDAVQEVTTSGVPVVVTSRCAQGRVEPIYGKGGGKDLEAAGTIFAGDLTGPKARVLLAVLLGDPGVPDLKAAVASIAG